MNSLHVGAVHDALDNIGLFQSVCGQFKLISYTLRYYETSFFTASFHLLNHLRGNSAATRDILIEVLVDEGKARVVSSVTK